MLTDERLWVQNGFVIPGNYMDSLLWKSLKGIGAPTIFPMPPSGFLNQTPEIDRIQNWIANMKRTVTVLPSNGGTVTPGGTFPIGSHPTFTASPNPGWRFDHWTDDNDNNNTNPVNPLTITVPWCDITYTAVFQAQAVGSSLANASTRLLVQTGSNIGIAGFIITGQSQKVVIRGLGPTLSQFGVEGALSDPVLSLFDQAGQKIASNDDWITTLIDGTIITGDQFDEIQNNGFAPASALESVIIATLSPGNYTVQLRGYNDATGVALVEVYGLPQNSPTTLSNLSTRALVQTGNDVMIGGFIIVAQSQTVVIRALGRTLSRFGVQGVLDNPQLLLFDEGGQLIARNDDWQTTVVDGTIITGDQVNLIKSLGFAPLSVIESVIVATLPPGNYTAQLQGAANTTGVALVELYTLP